MALALVIEQDAALRGRVGGCLREAGHRVVEAASLEQGRVALAGPVPAVAILGFHRSDGEEIAFLRHITSGQSGLPVIMVTDRLDNALAVTAMKEGACDFLRQPFRCEELAAAVHDALLEHNQGPAVPDHTPGSSGGVPGLVGRSRAIVEVCKQIGRVAPTDASVLVTGESGTGKEIVARAIHAYSGCPGPFQPVNCAAIVDTLLESELFGHEKGSFTDAIARKEGKFELADQGVLFLDEISELPLRLQAKLLRVLQEGVYERVGGTQALRSTARIVAASNQDLAERVRGQRFREDLYYRINVVTIALPPLRDRMEDLPGLVEFLLGRISGRLNRRVSRVSDAALRVLAAHAWPGNVRELENVLTRAVIKGHGDVLAPGHIDLDPVDRAGLPAAAGPAPGATSTLAELEAAHVAAILARTGWHRGQACAILGISRPALERKIRKYGLAGG
jgi:two-component system response regulator AtoC